MKIAILTSSFPRTKGDFQGNFILYLAAGQVKLGHEVHVICPHVPGLRFCDMMEGVHVHRFPYFFPYTLERLSSESGMYSSLRSSLLAWFQLPFFLFCEWYCTERIIRKNSIELIHSHWIIPQGIVGSISARIHRLPHVMSSHVADVQVFSRGFAPSSILRLILSGADCLTTNSTFTHNEIAKLCTIPCPSEVIPMGTFPVFRNEGIRHLPEESPIILFVGRLIRWKGVETLIQAMPFIHTKISSARLVIIGDGPERTHLEQTVRDKQLHTIIKFTGKVDDKTRTDYYYEASVFVLPSQQQNGMVMEGLGVVLLEAMAAGCPVIGSNVGGIPDIIIDGENGFLVPERDPEALAEKIVSLLSDQELSERFRQEGFRTVQTRFSWEDVSGRFSRGYSHAADLQKIKGIR